MKSRDPPKTAPRRAITAKWKLVLDDEEERIRRHRAVLAALEDSLLSPQGALTATMLPHLTDLQGVIALRTTTGRAPLYSALQPDFIERLTQLADDATLVVPFETINAFHKHMHTLRTGSTPALPVRLQQQRDQQSVAH